MATVGAIPKVEFHTGVSEPHAFACRLVRKALGLGARLAVSAPPATLETLDRLLWTFEPGAFLPHRRTAGSSARQLARTPVWLLDDQGPLAPGHPDVLINLDGPPAAGPAGWSRVIEIVADEPDAAARARARWRHYEAWGARPHHHAGG